MIPAEHSHIDPHLESEYNNSARRGDLDKVVADWVRRSSEQREELNCCMDLAYGGGDRERMDVFTVDDGPDAPTLIYIHGGYWQRHDKSIYSFVAEPFVNNGANVVIPNYDLCPAATIPGITDQIQQAIIWLWRNAESLGISSDHINVSGHSAGGHLTAMMLATDWPVLGDDIPADIIKGAIMLSGIYELGPLRNTTINDAAGIDEWTASDYSPLYLSPTSSAPLLVSLGGSESSQFHQQSRKFVTEWTQYDVEIAHHIEPGVDHFDVVNRLADAGSELFKRARAWLR